MSSCDRYLICAAADMCNVNESAVRYERMFIGRWYAWNCDPDGEGSCELRGGTVCVVVSVKICSGIWVAYRICANMRGNRHRPGGAAGHRAAVRATRTSARLGPARAGRGRTARSAIAVRALSISLSLDRYRFDPVRSDKDVRMERN